MTQKFKTKKISKQTNKKFFFPDFKGILCPREGIEKKKNRIVKETKRTGKVYIDTSSKGLLK